MVATYARDRGRHAISLYHRVGALSRTGQWPVKKEAPCKPFHCWKFLLITVRHSAPRDSGGPMDTVSIKRCWKGSLRSDQGGAASHSP